MNFFKYSLKDNKLTRKVEIGYITKEQLELSKNKSLSAEALFSKYISYRNGLLNATTIEIENKWFEAFNKKDLKTVISIEENNEYLRSFRNLRTTKTRSVRKIIKLSDEDVKEIIRITRDEEVRTLEDTISDLAKLVSFNYSITRAIYSSMSDENKNKIEPHTRALIEFSLEKFGTTDTRADRQLKTDGTNLITALMVKEEKIADIIDNVKKLNNA